jgi:hypothetical protein
MRAVAAVIAVAGLTAAATAQNVTLSITGLPAGNVANGTSVTGFVRLSWTATGGIGYAGGAFRLRMDGLSVADVTVPNEVNTERVGINGASTVWSSGRRPRTLDGNTTNADGTFRFPPQGTGATNVGYRVETQSGATYLTGRNGGGTENQIEHAQLPPALMPTDSELFVSAASFDLFKFTVRAPLTGSGTVTITPEMLSAAIFTSVNGAQVQTTANQRTMVAGSFTYTPAPSTLALLGLGGLVAGRRRR